MTTPILGKIYRILSDSHPEVLPYYGSTTQTLKKIWGQHKCIKNNCASKQIMIYEDTRIELVEELLCESEEDLLVRKKWYIENNSCCNKNIPLLSEEERNAYNKTYNKAYIDSHKEKRNAYNKVYNELHKEEIKAYRQLHKEELNAKAREYYAKKKLINATTTPPNCSLAGHHGDSSS